MWIICVFEGLASGWRDHARDRWEIQLPLLTKRVFQNQISSPGLSACSSWSFTTLSSLGGWTTSQVDCGKTRLAFLVRRDLVQAFLKKSQQSCQGLSRFFSSNNGMKPWNLPASLCLISWEIISDKGLAFSGLCAARHGIGHTWCWFLLATLHSRVETRRQEVVPWGRPYKVPLKKVLSNQKLKSMTVLHFTPSEMVGGGDSLWNVSISQWNVSDYQQNISSAQYVAFT